MTIRVSIFVLFILAYQACYAQQDSAIQQIQAGKPHQVWLFSMTDRLRQIGSGEVYQVYDDSLSLIKTGKNLSRVTAYPVRDIDQIWLRPKGQKVTSALIGFGAGLVAGVVIGLVSKDDPKCNQCWVEGLTAREKGLLSAIILAPTGMGIGIAVGSAKIKIPIDRKKEKYLRVKDKLKTVQYVPPR